MRTAPPVHLHCRSGAHDRWWLAGWMAAGLAACGISIAWCALHWPKDGAAMRATRPVLPTLCLLLSAGGLRRAWQTTRHGWQLHWDGQCWWLQRPAQAPTPDAGQIRVAMDLGDWLLLQFRPAPGPASARGRPADAWLTVSRARHAGQWHLLRCAVYSPRPPAPAMAAATHHLGASRPATAPDER